MRWVVMVTSCCVRPACRVLTPEISRQVKRPETRSHSEKLHNYKDKTFPVEPQMMTISLN